MVVVTCVITLDLPAAHSLKDKRRILKSILTRMRHEYNVSVAEIDHQDVWHTAVIGLATIGNDGRYLHGLLEKSVGWLETNRPDLPINGYSIEII